MTRMFLFIVMVASALHVVSSLVAPLRKRDVDFYDPAGGGGSMLDRTSNGKGEPLNVIISGQSSPEVLSEDGFLNYARALGFSGECLGFHRGIPQTANLGDGRGHVNEVGVFRQHFGMAALLTPLDNFGLGVVGTCLESMAGGNHFRLFRQNGPDANSSALFLAVSQEKDLAHRHKISPNGYNIGRDRLVASAVGQISFRGVTYMTVAKNLTNLIKPGSHGINHGIKQDGVTVLLTVTTTASGSGDASPPLQSQGLTDTNSVAPGTRLVSNNLLVQKGTSRFPTLSWPS